MRRILVVDDDRHVRLAIAAWLKGGSGFRVAVADGSANGLAALDDTSFDLMIVDILMPDMRGFESIRLFHQRAPTVPLIAISGYAFSGCRSERSRLPEIGPEPWGDTVPAQAVQAIDVARLDRRVPVGSRTAAKTCRYAFHCRQCVVRAKARYDCVQY